MPRAADVAVGEQLEGRSVAITQERVLRYAGASGDFNPLHWDAATAADVSPTGGIIAHGMLSMGVVAAMVADWAGGAGRVRSLSSAFKAPCPVGSVLRTGGEVLEVDAVANTAKLAVWAVLEDGGKVVDRRSSRAEVLLD